MKILVIGVGSIGERHARNLIKLGHDVYGSDLLAKKMPTGIKQSLGKFQDYDAVVVALPTKYHYDELTAAVKSGKPVFIEKPISDRDEGVRAILEEALQDQIVVMTGYNLRFHSCVAQAEIWLKDQKIGKPLWAQLVCAQYTDKSAYKSDGVAINWSHEIDLALHLLGPAKVKCASNHHTGEVEDMMDMVLEHESGVRSNIHLDYITPNEVRATVIVGEKGRIMIDLVRRAAVLNLGDREPVIEAFTDTWDDNYLWEMEAFVNRIGGNVTPGASGWDGLNTLNIALEARNLAK